MIGAYSVGTFPIGSIVQETGLAVLSLELAEATTDGNTIQPLVVLTLGNADASALSLDAASIHFIDLGFADATAEPLLFGEKVSPSLGFATAIAAGQAPIPIIRFKIGRAEGTTQSLNFVPKTFLDAAVANGETLTIDLITKTTLSGSVAEAIMQGNDIVTISRLAALVAEAQVEGNDIQLRVLPGLGIAGVTAEAIDMGGVVLGTLAAESFADAQDAAMKAFLELGGAEAVTGVNTIATKTLLDTVFATAIAAGQTPIPLIRFKIGRAEGVATGNDVVPKVDLVLGNAQTVANASDMSGVGLGILPARAFARAKDTVPKTFLDADTGEVAADALAVVPLSKLELLLANSIVDANNVVTLTGLDMGVAEAIVNGLGTDIGVETTEAAAIASALDGDATFYIEDIPDIVVTRSADLTQAVLKVLNDEVGNVNIYRADDHRALFSKVATNQASPYTDTGLDPINNFKYKATFVILGTKGGQSVEVEGGKSEPRYTIGNNTL